MKKPFVSIVEARKKLGDYVNKVRHTGQPIALGRYGKIEAYLIPTEALPAAQEDAAAQADQQKFDHRILFDYLDRLEEDLSIVEGAWLNDLADKHGDTRRFYYWAMIKKAEEIIAGITFIMTSLKKECKVLFKFVPVFENNMRLFLHSLSRSLAR